MLVVVGHTLLLTPCQESATLAAKQALQKFGNKDRFSSAICMPQSLHTSTFSVCSTAPEIPAGKPVWKFCAAAAKACAASKSSSSARAADAVESQLPETVAKKDRLQSRSSRGPIEVQTRSSEQGNHTSEHVMQQEMAAKAQVCRGSLAETAGAVEGEGLLSPFIAWSNLSLKN